MTAIQAPRSELPTVLLIEDNPGDARLIREMLLGARASEFRFEWIESLSSGLDRLAAGGIAVILLDLSLPESQGLDTFHRVRGNVPGMPIVVLTGTDDEELGCRAVQSGAQDYLTKGQVDGHLLSRALRYAIERGRIEEELRQRVAQLAEMDRRKDEFLATLAHELRNPLAPIRNAIGILRLSRGNGHADERMHEMMERQIAHLVRLVDDLMDVSRITRGKIDLRLDWVELSAVVNSAIEAARPQIESGRHQLNVELSAEPIALHADSVRLTQVVSNLLNNAAKYTEESGQIWLTAGQQGDEAIISVRDTGLGIPADTLPRVFDMFAQVDRTLKRSQGGLGIGLSLARRLVELHGGRIEARSAGPSLGSEFIVRLPLRREGQLPPQDAHGEFAPPPVRAPLRILVVDDNRDAADSLGMLLKFLGADTQVLYDGPSALAAATAFRPRIVFLDIGMPGMDGHEVARRLRQDKELPNVMLIALTGWGQDDDCRRSRVAGFDYHLVKPVDADALHALFASADSLPPADGSH